MLPVLVGLSGCNDGAFANRDDLAILVIREEVYTGNNRTVYEYTTAGTTVTATVKYYYNHPTGEESYAGTLVPIYKSVAGETPGIPENYRSVKSILPVFEKYGWQVVEDTSRNVATRDAMQTQVRKIKFRRVEN